MSMSLVVNGSLTIGTQVVPYTVTPTGDLLFHGGSRAKAVAIVEAIDTLVQRGSSSPTLSSAAVPVAALEATVGAGQVKLAKDGTRRGRPPEHVRQARAAEAQPTKPKKPKKAKEE
ncbi:MAG TPA: hypothetical protein PK095_00225 [Myxococcota bacterium]|nr:hypothetical protein [Myxococcota bacterium]